MSKHRRPEATAKLLPQFVGYREVCEALGYSRRTLERMVRAGTFPKPVQLAPNRVGWDVKVVEADLERRSKGLAASAVADPENLSPEQAEDVMRELGAQRLSQLTGETIDPAQVETNYWSDKTDYDTRLRLISRLREICNHFEPVRAQYVAAAVFEELRLQWAENESNKVLREPELLRKIASAALDDDDWREMIESLDVEVD